MNIQSTFNEIFILIEKDKTIKAEAKRKYRHRDILVSVICFLTYFFLSFFLDSSILKFLLFLILLISFGVIKLSYPYKQDETLKNIILSKVDKLIQTLSNSNDSLPKEFFELDRNYVPNKYKQ